MTKTAYEMRISDWSSDVCSSDLLPGHVMPVAGKNHSFRAGGVVLGYAGNCFEQFRAQFVVRVFGRGVCFAGTQATEQFLSNVLGLALINLRSEERRVGIECVSTFRTRVRTYNIKKKRDHI